MFDTLIDAEASAYGLDSELVKGLIGQESGFDPKAIGDDGTSYGLMQVQEATARGVGVTGNLLDPANNVRAGTIFLAQQIKRAGSVAAGLSAYNGGYRPALGFGAPLSDGRFRNQAYVDAVLRNWTYFRNQAKPTVTPELPDIASGDRPSLKVGLFVLLAAALAGGLWVLLR
jgi:soluble lytic murein transglycosylase-like protein